MPETAGEPRSAACGAVSVTLRGKRLSIPIGPKCACTCIVTCLVRNDKRHIREWAYSSGQSGAGSALSDRLPPWGIESGRASAEAGSPCVAGVPAPAWNAANVPQAATARLGGRPGREVRNHQVRRGPRPRRPKRGPGGRVLTGARALSECREPAKGTEAKANEEIAWVCSIQ